MKVTYRITSWRFDVTSHTYGEFTFEGETVEDCDRQALEFFDAESAKKSNAWDGMSIVRIDRAAVSEMSTMLKSNERQVNDEWSL